MSSQRWYLRQTHRDGPYYVLRTEQVEVFELLVQTNQLERIDQKFATQMVRDITTLSFEYPDWQLST